MYMYQSHSLLDRAHDMVSILSLHHQHSFVLPSCPPALTLPPLSTLSSGVAKIVCTRRPEAHTPTILLCRQLRPSSHLSHIGPACPNYIDAPAAASGLGPHISISMINAPATSPRLRLDDTSAGDTAPVSCIRCVRVARA